MKLDSELCHVDSNKIIVRISASINNVSLGSALGEGSSVREAEDSAIKEILKRIKKIESDETTINLNKIHPEGNIDNQYTSIKKVRSDKINNSEKKNETDSKQYTLEQSIEEKLDWSDEISDVDNELERIGWSRNEEQIIMQKTIGYLNRSRITEINELIMFRDILKMINKNEDINSIDNIFNTNKLINDSSYKIKLLNWDKQQSINFLKSNFNEVSRNKLSLKQLISFNLLLDKEIAREGIKTKG